MLQTGTVDYIFPINPSFITRLLPDANRPGLSNNRANEGALGAGDQGPNTRNARVRQRLPAELRQPFNLFFYPNVVLRNSKLNPDFKG